MKKFIFVLFVFSLAIINKEYALAEELPSDVIKKFGYTDDRIINVDDYEYHFIVSSHYTRSIVLHFYSNSPIKIRYQYTSGSHMFLAETSSDTIDFIQYDYQNISNGGKQRTTTYGNFMLWDGDKEDILYMDLIPKSYDDLTYNKSVIYHISGPLGIATVDDSLADLGYPKNTIFFFQGTYSPESDVSPLVPSTQEPVEPTSPGGLDDEDRGWLSGLFSGITESITNVTGSIIDGVVSAFQAVGQFIIDGIKDLFLPSDGFFTDKIDGIKSKFDFVDNIKNAQEDFMLALEDTTEEIPKISINLNNANSKYNYGDTALALDMSWYADFKPFVDVIIIAFAYLGYMFLVYKRLPDIINGAGAITSTVTSKKK